MTSSTMNPEPPTNVIPMSQEYQICSKTVMDTSDPNITFDSNGVCNHVEIYEQLESQHVLCGNRGEEMLLATVDRIKRHGRSGSYDCILGLSGGVDSTYLCMLAKEHGLRPLVVHFDNGWNSELAVHNIENTVRKLGFDLYTYVVNWPEFRDLQRAYIKASVIDIEVLTDHGFMAVLYAQARKHRIKFVLGGMNVVTEGILPSDWIYSKADLVNIQAIHSAHGDLPRKKLQSYPSMTALKRKSLQMLSGLEVISPLNWIDFTYAEVKARITEELGWRDYGGKHYESIFTRFYQGYILPNKFGIDKRRAHLSTLVCSGQLTRESALEQISSPGYDKAQCAIDRPFVLKKLGFTATEFDSYINTPRVEHRQYDHWKSIFQSYPLLKHARTAVKSLRRSA